MNDSLCRLEILQGPKKEEVRSGGSLGASPLRERIATHVRELPRSGIRDFFELVRGRRDVISLGIGEPDFVTPWHIREAAVYALDHGATAYTSNLGLQELREAVADYVRRTCGVTYHPHNEILITVGVSEGLDLAVRAVVEPGDEVLCHEPCYVSYVPVVRLAHGRPVMVETTAEERFRIRRSDLESRVSSRTKALLLNFPTNPTGATLDRHDAEALADFAIEHDLLVISDEVYLELTYEGERISMASLPGMRERTILLNGFSKAWAMTGFRLGFACAPSELIDAMMKIHQYTMLCAPIVSQKAAVEALRNGDEDVARMREEYRRRRNWVCAAFQEMGLPCVTPNGAFYAFPSIAGLGVTSREFALRLLDEEGVACVPGTAFGRSGEGHIRCSFATDLGSLKDALDRMAAFVRRLRS